MTRTRMASSCHTIFVQHVDDTWNTRGRASTILRSNNNRWDEDIEERSRRRAAQAGSGGGKSGIGETAAGAILGGLLLGPFGALFGASIGSNIGAKNAVNDARKKEMERLGISQEMLDSANEIGIALDRCFEGLKATQDSLQTQQRFARRLDTDANEIYDKAKEAISRSDEELARKLLLDRQQILDKLKQVLKNCADERKRIEQMESNVAALELRAMEMDSLLRRTVGAKAVSDSASLSSSIDVETSLSLSTEDPLLKKFRDEGIM